MAKRFERLHVTNVDSSRSAIAAMQAAASQRCTFVEDDVLNSKLPACSFHLCLDKGTLDAMEYGSAEQPRLYLEQVFRILKPGGVFLQYSLCDPAERDVLRELPWAAVSWTSVDDANSDSDSPDLELGCFKCTKPE